jgi:hypothetical protein
MDPAASRTPLSHRDLVSVVWHHRARRALFRPGRGVPVGAGWDTALAKLGCVTVLAGLRLLMGHWHGARPGPGASLRVSDCPNVEDFVLVDEGL